MRVRGAQSYNPSNPTSLACWLKTASQGPRQKIPIFFGRRTFLKVKAPAMLLYCVEGKVATKLANSRCLLQFNTCQKCAFSQAPSHLEIWLAGSRGNCTTRQVGALSVCTLQKGSEELSKSGPVHSKCCTSHVQSHQLCPPPLPGHQDENSSGFSSAIRLHII